MLFCKPTYLQGQSYSIIKRQLALELRTVLYPKGTNTNRVLFPDLRTQKSKCSIPRWATYVGLLGMPIKRQETKKSFFKSLYLVQLLYFSSDIKQINYSATFHILNLFKFFIIVPPILVLSEMKLKNGSAEEFCINFAQKNLLNFLYVL